MARRSHSRTFARPSGRQSLWLGAGLTVTTMAGGASTLLATLNAAALLLRPFTIVRSRLVIFFRSDQVATSEFVQAVLSAQVVIEVAAAAGIASVPTPLTETDADFFIYQPLMARIEALTSVGAYERGADQSWVIDSKAMRKVSTDDDVAFVGEIRGAPGANIAMEGRMLVKLH